MKTIRWWAAAAGLLAVLATVGCGADGADTDGGGVVPGVGDGQAEAPADDSGGSETDGDGSGETGGEAAGVLVDGRSIIYTGDIAVRVEDVARAAGQAAALATRYGGFVSGDERSADAEHATATLVLRIPSENFTTAVDQLGALGEEESRLIRTEDVTEEVVDLESRIATARASVARTRELMQQARSISDIVALEEELAARESRLASLEARQRRLADLTALSTITVTLFSQDAPAPEEPEQGFLAGLRAGWDGLVASMHVLLTVLGVLLPWLVVVGAPAAAVTWWVRRRRAHRASPTPVGEPGTGTVGGT